jgi:hypothetical protein
MYRIRFNLESGPYCGWWLVESFLQGKWGVDSWVNPTTNSLHLVNCELSVDRSVSNRIHAGKSTKRGCAWIKAEHVAIVSAEGAHNVMNRNWLDPIQFNPKVSPHWRYKDRIADNQRIRQVLTVGRCPLVLCE